VTLVLASLSATRRAMLAAAGVAHEAVGPRCDEEEIKRSLRAAGISPRDQADALAEAKALSVSRRLPGALVLGGDQTCEDDDGAVYDKPADAADAVGQLRALAGRRHRLHSAAVVARDGVAVWRVIETAALLMRPLGEQFIADYVTAERDDGHHGLYRIEGRGAQLFTEMRGSHYAILGLPLLPLLAWLRVTGRLPE
jgi:septum formation protein